MFLSGLKKYVCKCALNGIGGPWSILSLLSDFVLWVCLLLLNLPGLWHTMLPKLKRLPDLEFEPQKYEPKYAHVVILLSWQKSGSMFKRMHDYIHFAAPDREHRALVSGMRIFRTGLKVILNSSYNFLADLGLETTLSLTSKFSGTICLIP